MKSENEDWTDILRKMYSTTVLVDEKWLSNNPKSNKVIDEDKVWRAEVNLVEGVSTSPMATAENINYLHRAGLIDCNHEPKFESALLRLTKEGFQIVHEINTSNERSEWRESSRRTNWILASATAILALDAGASLLNNTSFGSILTIVVLGGFAVLFATLFLGDVDREDSSDENESEATANPESPGLLPRLNDLWKYKSGIGLLVLLTATLSVAIVGVLALASHYPLFTVPVLVTVFAFVYANRRGDQMFGTRRPVNDDADSATEKYDRATNVVYNLIRELPASMYLLVPAFPMLLLSAVSYLGIEQAIFSITPFSFVPQTEPGIIGVQLAGWALYHRVFITNRDRHWDSACELLRPIGEYLFSLSRL